MIFLVSGLWHGANWTFIAWGLLNALYFLPLMLLNRNRKNLLKNAENKLLPSLKDIFSMMATFGLTVFAWIFFRAENLAHLRIILERIFSPSLFHIPAFDGRRESFYTLLWAGGILIVEWLGRDGDHALEKFGRKWNPAFRWIFYYGLIYVVFLFSGNEQQFIYFQF